MNVTSLAAARKKRIRPPTSPADVEFTLHLKQDGRIDCLQSWVWLACARERNRP